MALVNDDAHGFSTFIMCYFGPYHVLFFLQIWSYRGISAHHWKPLTASQIWPPSVETRGEEKHLDYIPGVSITLEMEVAKRADSCLQQGVRLLQNDSVDSETYLLMELNVSPTPEVNMEHLPTLNMASIFDCKVWGVVKDEITPEVGEMLDPVSLQGLSLQGLYSFKESITCGFAATENVIIKFCVCYSNNEWWIMKI